MMDELIDRYRVRVEPEEDVENPMREFEMLTDVVTWMRSYEFSSEQPKPYDSPHEVMRAVKNGEVAFASLLFAYIHSGITIHMEEMKEIWPDKQWDCGLAGCVYIRMEKAKKEWPKLSRRALNRACRKRAMQDVEVLDQWLRGDVWVYDVIDPNGELVDSCGWIYGYDDACNMAMEALEKVREEREGKSRR
jgi:hypothetical protein